MDSAADRTNWTADTTRIVSTVPGTTVDLMVGLASLRRAFAQQRLVLRDPSAKQAYLEIAQQWRQLAEHAEHMER